VRPTFAHRLLLLPIFFLVTPALASVHVWVDDNGVTHITDGEGPATDTGANPPSEGRAALRGLWTSFDDPEVAAALRGSSSSSAADDRTRRLIRGAMSDLERGESSRAAATLRNILRDDPGCPEAHWLLAMMSRERGRYESAEAHLRAFLGAAGDALEPLREEARKRLAALEDEKRLANTEIARSPTWLGLASENFSVHYDAELGDASPVYSRTVLGFLEEARESVGERLGRLPEETMGVVFYGKAAYLQAHRHRFSFQTVGFFDGRIHVVSAGHPEGELRALLFHQYTHAVFSEQNGGGRPNWLNEGLAELSERASRGTPATTRGERSSLRMRIEEGRWIPLLRLAPSFSGLDDRDARAAYLQSLAAAAWIESQTDRAARARILARISDGVAVDDALMETLSLDTEGVEKAVQKSILAEFSAAMLSHPASDPANAGEEAGGPIDDE
jgi:hypothetical protein